MVSEIKHILAPLRSISFFRLFYLQYGQYERFKFLLLPYFLENSNPSYMIDLGSTLYVAFCVWASVGGGGKKWGSCQSLISFLPFWDNYCKGCGWASWPGCSRAVLTNGQTTVYLYLVPLGLNTVLGLPYLQLSRGCLQETDFVSPVLKPPMEDLIINSVLLMIAMSDLCCCNRILEVE